MFRENYSVVYSRHFLCDVAVVVMFEKNPEEEEFLF